MVVPKPNEAYAYFVVQGDDLDPDEITREIGIDPTEAWRRGDQHPRTSRPRTRGGWTLRSRLPGSAELEAHVADVLSQLETKPQPFQRLATTRKGCMQLVGYFYSNYPGLHFSSDTVERLARFALSVDCDFYYLRNEESRDEE